MVVEDGESAILIVTMEMDGAGTQTSGNAPDNQAAMKLHHARLIVKAGLPLA